MRTLSAGWQSTYWNTARLSSSCCVHLIAFALNLTLIVSIIFAKTLTERLKTRWYQRFENYYTVPANVLFSDVKRQISLVLKVTAKMYLFFFRLKDKAEDSWRHSILGGRGNYLDVIALSCNAIIIGRRIHTSRMASFWIPSHIIILYAIYIYMFNLYSPFIFQMTGRSSLWIGITVHVNYRLESIAYR